MIREEIKQDLSLALKKRQARVVSVLRLLLATLINEEKEKRYQLKKSGQVDESNLDKQSQLGDEEMVALIKAEIKKRNETIEGFQKAGRKDRVQTEQEAIRILEKYLPRADDQN